MSFWNFFEHFLPESSLPGSSTSNRLGTSKNIYVLAKNSRVMINAAGAAIYPTPGCLSTPLCSRNPVSTISSGQSLNQTPQSPKLNYFKFLNAYFPRASPPARQEMGLLCADKGFVKHFFRPDIF
jgi:hypothetical protein